MSQYNKFYDYLADLLLNHQKLSALLLAKLDAIEKQDIDRLDQVIKDEQVFVLVSKSFDANIKKYREQLSLKGDTLSEIIPGLPEEERQRFRDLYQLLRSCLTETKALNDKCQELLEERIYSLNKAIKELDKSVGVGYGKDSETPKKPGDGNPHFLSKTI